MAAGVGRWAARVLWAWTAVFSLHAVVGALPPDHPAVRLLTRARNAIRTGTAAEAVPPLEELRRLFPRTPEADEAERLLRKIASLEVLIDRSHKWRPETDIVARYLRDAGIGTTVSDASLESLKDRLDDYEMILIWQQENSVSFTSEEILMLKGFCRNGGRLLLIGTAQPAGPCPMARLLKAMDCPMRGPSTQVNYGEGKVRFFDNTGLFDGARLADPRESRQEVVEVFAKFMPYEPLGKSSLSDEVVPEIGEEIERFRLQYSARLTTPAEQMKPLVAKIIEQTTLTYRDELPRGMIVRILPRTYSGWLGGVTFAAGALQPTPELARELARAFTLYGLFPAAEWISYPPWISTGWCDLVALRTCYRIGFKPEAEAARKEYLDAYKPNPKTPDGIDLSVSRMAGRPDYVGKAQWVLETLEKKHGKNLLARLRKTLKDYAAVGRIGGDMSTRDVIFYLSQTLREDMFAYFQSIGTTVLPVKLDYDELEKGTRKE